MIIQSSIKLSIIPNLFGKMTGSSGRVNNFIIKNGEVESKTEPDGMGGLHFWLCYVKCFLIRFLWILDYRCNANREIQITIFINFKMKLNIFFFFGDKSIRLSCVYVCTYRREQEKEEKEKEATIRFFPHNTLSRVYVSLIDEESTSNKNERILP